MATLATLRTNIQSRLKDPDGVRVSDADVAAAINAAINKWKRKQFWFNEFSEDVTLDADDTSFALEDNTPLYLFEESGAVIVQDSQYYPLEKVSSSKFDIINIGGTGRPYAWVYRNDGFEIYFTADQEYTLRCRGIKDYIAFETDGTQDSSSNDFTNDAQALIEYEALARLHAELLQDENMAQYFRDEAMREYEDLKDFDGEKTATGEIEIHSALI